VEEVRIDGYAEDLVPIQFVVVADDGGIAITQAQDAAIRFFTAEGEPAGRFGVQGEGPGEFLMTGRLGWLADTLWVFDPRVRRMTLISPERELVRTISNISAGAAPPPHQAEAVPEYPFAAPLGLDPRGSLLVTLQLAVNQPVPDRFQGRGAIGRMSADGTLENLLALLPLREGGTVTTPEGEAAGTPFGNRPHYGVAHDGSRVVVAMASLDGAEAGTFRLTGIAAGGDTLFAHRHPFEPEPLPGAVADSVLGARIARLETSAPHLAAAVRRDAEVPPLYPPIENVLIGEDLSIWVEKRVRDGARPYYVAESNGTPVGTLHLPERSRVAAASLERIWVLERDEFDVQSVVGYGVEWE
jgi:hypothetical protein